MFTVLEMTTHSIANPLMEFGDGFGLGEDGFPGSASIEPALPGLFNDEDDLFHGFALSRA